ncbi:RNA recognition motif-containing protein [Toxoplasma gondii MAS]|uniref:RNA recognition motif-containing protein n=1 Tax=Toxoplasma gondii MAS TaxID=943118 RepID=A0A086PXF4_TOXGO|nr:RNA recognition motif-containing protein [Toxoplasma gondii MAS]
MRDSKSRKRPPSSLARREATQRDRGRDKSVRGSAPRGRGGRSLDSTRHRFSGSSQTRGRGGMRGRTAHAVRHSSRGGTPQRPVSASSAPSKDGQVSGLARGGRGARGGRHFGRGRGRGGLRRQASGEDASASRQEREGQVEGVLAAETGAAGDAEDGEYEKGSILALLGGQGSEQNLREETPPSRKKACGATGEERGEADGLGKLFNGGDDAEKTKHSKKRKRDPRCVVSVEDVGESGEEGRSKKKEQGTEGSSLSCIFSSRGNVKATVSDAGLSRLSALFSASALADADEGIENKDGSAKRVSAASFPPDSSSLSCEVADSAASKTKKKRGTTLQSAIKKARAVAALHREAMAKKAEARPQETRKTKKKDQGTREEREEASASEREEDGEEREETSEGEAQAAEAEAGWRETEKEKDCRTVFVGNLPLSGWKPPALYRHLGIGRKDVESIRLRSIPVHPKFNKCRLGGLVKGQFTDLKDFQNAYIVLKDRRLFRSILQHDGTSFQGRRLRVDEAGERGRNVFSRFDRKKTVFVGNLPSRCSEEDLRRALESNGTVKAVRIIRDKVTTESKGFGFVCFEDRVSAARAVLASNGVVSLQGKTLRVTRALDEATSKMEDANRRHEKEKKRARRGGVGRGLSPAVRRMIQKKQRKIAKRYENRGYTKRS